MPGVPELIIIAVVALLLFGGSRLAGIGKGMGRSIREFKEEVKSVDDGSAPETVDAEIVTETHPGTEKSQAERVRELEAREAELAAREERLRAEQNER